MEGTHDTAITLFQIKVESISKPKKSEIKLHDLAKVYKLPRQEITTFTTNKILRLPEQFSPSNDLFYSKEATNKIAQEEFKINVLGNSELLNAVNVPTQSDIQSVTCDTVLPVMQVGFPPSI